MSPQPNTNKPLSFATQRLLVWLAVMQSLLLLLGKQWLEPQSLLNPAWLAVYFSVSLTTPALLLLMLENRRRRFSWICGLGFAVLIGFQSYHLATQCHPSLGLHCGLQNTSFVLTTTITWFVLLPFLQTWQQRGKPSAHYPALFEYSWNNTLVLASASVFFGLGWLLLTLWAELFELLGIHLFKDLFREPSFYYPASGFLMGQGIAIARNQGDTLVQLREKTLRWIFKGLTPLLCGIALLFLAALLFTGVAPLTQTGSAASVLCWLSVALIVFINAVVLSFKQPQLYPKPIRLVVELALFALPIFTGMALWAIYLRVQQYGWTLERLWASYIAVLLLGYGLGYALTVVSTWLRPRGHWLASIQAVNTSLALLLIVSLAAINLGWPSFERIAVDNQVERLTAGTVGWDKLDTHYLRFDAGQYGYQQLLALQANPPLALSQQQQQNLQALLKANNRFELTHSERQRRRNSIDLSQDCSAQPSEMLVGDWRGTLRFNDEVSRKSQLVLSLNQSLTKTTEHSRKQQSTRSGRWSYASCLLTLVYEYTSSDNLTHYDSQVYWVEALSADTLTLQALNGSERHELELYQSP